MSNFNYASFGWGVADKLRGTYSTVSPGVLSSNQVGAISLGSLLLNDEGFC